MSVSNEIEESDLLVPCSSSIFVFFAYNDENNVAQLTLYLSAHKNNGNISVIIKTSTNKLKELNA
jgi:hypothetical protein